MVKNENSLFNKWLKENNISGFDFSGKPFPPAADREFWDEKADPEIIENGEKFLNYRWPIIRATQYMEFVKSGDRLSQETPSFARRRALAALLFAEVLEYKGRFLNDIVDGLFIICEETFWGVSAHAFLNEKKLISVKVLAMPCALFSLLTGINKNAVKTLVKIQTVQLLTQSAV